MTLLLIALYTVFFGVIIMRFSKREGYYSTITLMGVMSFLYYIGVPFDIWLSGRSWIIDEKHFVSLSPLQIDQIIGMAIMALLSFTIGYRISNFNPYLLNISKNTFFKTHIPSYLKILFLAGIMFLFIMFSEEITQLGTYSKQMEIMYNNSLLAYTVFLTIICFSIIGYIYLASNSRKILFGFILVIILFMWSLFIKTKEGFLYGLLACLPLLDKLHFNNIKALILIIIGSFMALKLSIIFSIYRGGAYLSLTEFIQVSKFTFRNVTELLGPMNSLSYVLNDLTEFTYGRTYLEAVYLLIPKAIWTDRPLSLAESFAREIDPGWIEGRGFGFSLLAEGYLNFWWFGIIIQYIAIGFLWGKFWKNIFRMFMKMGYSETSCRAIYCTFGYYILITMHRGPVSSLIKLTTIYFIPLILLALLLYGIKSSVPSIRLKKQGGKQRRG